MVYRINKYKICNQAYFVFLQEGFLKAHKHNTLWTDNALTHLVLICSPYSALHLSNSYHVVAKGNINFKVIKCLRHHF